MIIICAHVQCMYNAVGSSIIFLVRLQVNIFKIVLNNCQLFQDDHLIPVLKQLVLIVITTVFS
jgi:hypothetical protein